MSESLARQEVLDLLAKGKINIDEAIELLDQPNESTHDGEKNEPVFKADVVSENVYADTIKVIETDTIVDPSVSEIKSNEFREEPQSVDYKVRKPHWLRIRVANLESGKNKVSVNVPFAMVRFGLGVARVLSPKIDGVYLDEIDDMFSRVEEGLLVDVEDAESNEHVQIYLD